MCKAIDNGAAFPSRSRPKFPLAADHGTDLALPVERRLNVEGPGQDPHRLREDLRLASMEYRPFFAAKVIAAEALRAGLPPQSSALAGWTIARSDASRRLEVALLSSAHPRLEKAGDTLADMDNRLRRGISAAAVRSAHEVEQLALVADQYRLAGVSHPDTHLSPGWCEQASWASEAVLDEELTYARYDAFSQACAEFAAELHSVSRSTTSRVGKLRRLRRRAQEPAYTPAQVRVLLAWDPIESWERNFDGF